MRIKILFSGVILGLGAGVVLILIGNALAQSEIQYPVPELGNCKDEADCRVYCDQPQNLNKCLNFAEKHNLIPGDELKTARKFAAAGGEGPGGCTSQESCESYCNDIANIDECLEFAEENDLMPPDELEEARKVQAALAAGAQLPGGCRNKDECEDYCESGDPSRMEECIEFAEAAGFIPEDELEEARMVLEAIREGATPPPCRGREECDVYCSEPQNFEQCITFAEAAGFISPEEVEMARKTGGKGPGNCRGREECDAFCENENNFQICVDFAVEHGMMKPEEAEMAKKTGGKGPGNCRGREECEAFCQDPVNQEVCFNFGKEHGLIPEEDLRMMEEGKQKMMEGLLQAPPQVMECLTQILGSEMIEKIKAGTAMPGREMGDKMRQCFEQMVGQMGPPEGMPEGMPPGGPGMPEGFIGPGGCRTPEECTAYCQANPQECQGSGPPPEGVAPPEGFGPPPGVMPPSEQIQQFQQQFEGQVSPGVIPSPEQIQQFQQQMQQQFAPPSDTQYLAPPSDGSYAPSPDGSFTPPPSYAPPPDGSYTPPPDGSYAPPPSELPPPSSAAPQGSLLGNLLRSLLNLFR